MDGNEITEAAQKWETYFEGASLKEQNQHLKSELQKLNERIDHVMNNLTGGYAPSPAPVVIPTSAYSPISTSNQGFPSLSDPVPMEQRSNIQYCRCGHPWIQHNDGPFWSGMGVNSGDCQCCSCYRFKKERRKNPKALP